MTPAEQRAEREQIEDEVRRVVEKLGRVVADTQAKQAARHGSRSARHVTLESVRRLYKVLTLQLLALEPDRAAVRQYLEAGLAEIGAGLRASGESLN